MTRTFDELLRIAEAPTTAELWERLQQGLAAHGFDRVIYGATRLTRDVGSVDAQDIVFLSNHPEDVTSGLLDFGFFMRTPMFRWLLENSGACSWSWAEAEAAAGRLTQDELRARDMARRAGMVAGYSISIPGGSPRDQAAFSLADTSGCDQAAVDARWQHCGQAVQALCQMMHLKMMSLPLPLRRRPLSPRQREALEWVAEGKTSQDVAAIMGVSAAMVEKHLRLAREALNVETTAHAVAKAVLSNHLFTAGTAQRVGNSRLG